MVKRLLLLLVGLVLLGCTNNEANTTLPTFTPALNATPTRIPPTRTPIVVSTLPPVATLPPPVNVSDPNSDPALVRVIQASPVLELVDVYVGNQVVGARFGFGTSSSEPVSLVPGEYILAVVPSGSVNSPANRLLEDSIIIEPRSNFVLIIMGDAESLQARTFPLNLAPLDEATARLTVVHAVPNAPPISVVANGETVAEGIIYGNAQAGIELEATSTQVSFRAGTGALLNSTLDFDTAQVYTVILVGDATRGQFETVSFNTPAQPRTYLRVTNAARGSPSLRVYLDEQLVVENLDYQEFGDRFIPLVAGAYTLRLEDMAANVPLLTMPILLEANTEAELVIYDRPETLKAKLFPVNRQPVTSAEARLTIIHAVTGVSLIRPLVSSQLLDSALNLSNANTPPLPNQQLDFGTSLPSMVIGVGNQTFEFLTVDAAGNPSIMFTTPDLNIEQGNAYTYILMGRNGADSILLSTPITLVPREEIGAATAPEAESSVRFINAMSDENPLTIRLDGEQAAFNLAYGAISDPETVLANVEIQLSVQAETGTPILTTAYYATADLPATVILVGSPAAVQVIVVDQPPLLIDRNTALSSFINGLSSQDLISMYFFPANTSPTGVLNTPVSDAEITNVTNVGTTFEFGRFDTLQVFPGDYILRLNNALDGRFIEQVFFSTEGGTRTYYILLEKDGGVELLSVTE